MKHEGASGASDKPKNGRSKKEEAFVSGRVSRIKKAFRTLKHTRSWGYMNSDVNHTQAAC